MRVKFQILSAIVSVSLFLFVSSCGTDDPGDNGLIEIEKGILVLNEGGFQKGNSSLSFVNLESNNIETQLYESANEKLLGDVGQSMGVYDNKLYVVLNNSGLIKVIDPETFVESASISGFASPRYITSVGNDRAYVSNLFGNSINTLDLKTNTVSGSIALKGMTEKMAITGNDVYITNNSNKHVFVIDAQSDALIDSVDVGGKNDEIFYLNGKMVVMRNADIDNEIKAAFVTINPSNKQVESVVEYQATATVWDAKATLYNNKVYFLHENSVMYLENGAVNELFKYEGISAYNIAIFDDLIYITDAKDYSSTGAVLQYNMQGELLNTYATGIIPTAIMRYEK